MSFEAETDILNVVDILNYELQKFEGVAEKIKKEISCIDSQLELRIKRMNQLVREIEEIKEKISLTEDSITNSELNFIDLNRQKIFFEKIRNDQTSLISITELHNAEIEVSNIYFSIFSYVNYSYYLIILGF
jgi:hypothetical protein